MKSSKFLLIISFCSLYLITGMYGQDSVVVGSQHINKPYVISGQTMPDILNDSIYQLMVQGNKKKLNPILIINYVVIRDTLKIENFRKNYLPSVDKIEYLNKEQAFEKYGIKHEDGVLRIYTKKKKIIDL